MKQSFKYLLNSNNKTYFNMLRSVQKVNYCTSMITKQGGVASLLNDNASSIDWKVGEESKVNNSKPIMSPAKVAELYGKNHVQLSHSSFRPYGSESFTDVKELDSYAVKRSFQPKDLTDKTALSIMRFLRVFVHAFFGNRYMHHAVVLETVAAVPGMVAGAWKHFVSLRKMRKEQGYISELLEEAENERMHLITWMELCRPTLLERLLVIIAQIGFTSFYSLAYMIAPRFCHRLVGYLEEEAVNAYSEFLEAIDKGEIENRPAPDFAIKYWNLAPGSTLRDVVAVVRTDECMHRDYNHQLSSKYQDGILE